MCESLFITTFNSLIRDMPPEKKLELVQEIFFDLDPYEREVEILVSIYEYATLRLTDLGKKILQALDPNIWQTYDFTLKYPRTGTTRLPRHHPYLIQMARKLGQLVLNAPFIIWKVKIPRYCTYKIKIINTTYRDVCMEEEKVKIYIPGDVGLTNLDIPNLKSPEEVDLIIDQYLKNSANT